MDIRYNPVNGALYTVVEKESCYYLFYLASFDHGVECIGFPCDEKGEVTSYFAEVYVSFPRTVTRENLVACVEEFMAQ